MKSTALNKNTVYLQQLICKIPDFPQPGILFYDITSLLKDATGLHLATEALVAPFLNQSIDLVLGIEARGFIFAAMAAYRLQAGFIPVRKPHKLPGQVRQAIYSMEYGSQQKLEMHWDAIPSGSRVLIVDDLLATGGTANAAIEMAELSGATVVALAFLIELEALKGRNKLLNYTAHSVLKY